MGPRTAIVTGSNTGIGKETARGLAKLGYRVVLACRNPEAAERSRLEILADSGNPDLHVLTLDLASRESIRRFARAFEADFGRLDLLVNNAGISNTRQSRTVDGLEPIVGTNFFGTFALTVLLLPLFRPGGRIVTLVSNIYSLGRFRAERLNDYHWVKAYAVSKYLLLLFTLELSARTGASGIEAYAVHPGIVRTSIMYTGRWYDVLIKAILAPFFVDPEKGAGTCLDIASSEAYAGQGGRLFGPSGRIAIPEGFADMGLARRVWDIGMEHLEGGREGKARAD